MAALKLAVGLVDFPLHADGLGDAIVGGADFSSVGAIAGGLLERFFLRGLRRHYRRGVEPVDAAVVDLAGILDAEEILLGAAGVFLAAVAPVFQRDLEALQARHDVGVLHVAEKLEFRHRELAVRAAGVAGHEREFAFLCAGL